jgi:glycerate 2-kinase
MWITKCRGVCDTPLLKKYHTNAMKILIATDKFKDALSAQKVCEGLKKGILKTFPTAMCETLPLADGGEGTLETLQLVLGGEFIDCQVNDPLFRPIQAQYLWIESTQTAIVEMARASGIELLKKSERNALKTSTFGTGELILDAIKKGAKKIVLTVGGSATNDGGIGMANALGYQFLDENNNPLKPIGEHLIHIKKIDNSLIDRSLKNVEHAPHPNSSPQREGLSLVKKATLFEEKGRPTLGWEEVFSQMGIEFVVATDVTNPFYGKNGAAYVFCKQKGVDDLGIELLDKGLENLSALFQNTFKKNVQNSAGSGAGGGIGGGAIAFLDAQICSAADWILEITNVQEKLKNSDLLITGEGKIDFQTWQGKLISRLLHNAKIQNVPVILVCGTMQDVEQIVEQEGLIYAVSILNEPMSLENAISQTVQLIEYQGNMLGKMLSFKR